jgi:tetratricopeptide (TPR) repeat protein
VLRVGGAKLDLAEGRITAPDGTATELRRQSADVLRVLAAHAGRTVPKSELLDAVWGDIAVTEDSLVQCIADIRRALGSARDRLHTARRSGYRLETDAAGSRPWARIGLAAALADAASGRQVWARTWAGPADDLIPLQTAAAEALVGALAGRYSGAIARADRARAHRSKTANLAAYELYLLGIEHKLRFTLADYDLAEGYLLRATEIDPGFAKAWAALAFIQDILTSYATSDAEFAALDRKRRTYLGHALAADPDDPATLLEACKQAAYDGDPAPAERAARRAVAQAPNDADILAQAAWTGSGNAPIQLLSAWFMRAWYPSPIARNHFTTSASNFTVSLVRGRGPGASTPPRGITPGFRLSRSHQRCMSPSSAISRA